MSLTSTRTPPPGDPHRVRNLAKNLHDFADDVSKVLRDIKGMAGEDAILNLGGKDRRVVHGRVRGRPGQAEEAQEELRDGRRRPLHVLAELERSQALADKALLRAAKPRRPPSAQSRLTSADSWVTGGQGSRQVQGRRDAARTSPSPTRTRSRPPPATPTPPRRPRRRQVGCLRRAEQPRRREEDGRGRPQDARERGR